VLGLVYRFCRAVDLAGQKIGDSGAEAIAAALPSNNLLQW